MTKKKKEGLLTSCWRDSTECSSNSGSLFLRLGLRMCLGLELWVPNLVNMWLRHVVLDVALVMWSSRSGQKEVCTNCFPTGGHLTWSKGGCKFIEKKAVTATMWDKCFAKNGVVFLFVPFFALRKKINLFFHHPRFCTRIWVRLFLRLGF